MLCYVEQPWVKAKHTENVKALQRMGVTGDVLMMGDS
jgi:hypothetical protein